MPVKRPLTADEWIEAIKRCHLATVYARRVQLGMSVTLPAPRADPWFRVVKRLESLTSLLQCWRDDVTHKTLLKLPIPDGFPWFHQTKPGGHGKRTLARSEWALLGQQVKALRLELFATSEIMTRSAEHRDPERWARVVPRVDRLKADLDAECCRQHPDWPEATAVFYGRLLSEDPRLAASVDLAEIRTIVDMDDARAFDVVRHRPDRLPIRHWRQVLPIRPRRATA